MLFIQIEKVWSNTTILWFLFNDKLQQNEACEYLLHTFTTKVCTHIKPGWKWNYYVVVV
jgi:hypothetical protein